MGFNQTEFASNDVFNRPASSRNSPFIAPTNAEIVSSKAKSDTSSGGYLSEDQMKSLILSLSAAETSAAKAQIAAQTQADKDAMDFESKEASAYRTWAEEMQLDAQNFNSAQAALDRAFQKSSAEAAMRFERDERIAAQDYNTLMSNTAYQRAVNDLKAAGLNPILAYTQGGASAPVIQGGSGHSSSGSKATSGIASGSKASGKSSSRSKANISGIAQSVLNYSSNIVSNSAKMISAVSNSIDAIIPG